MSYRFYLHLQDIYFLSDPEFNNKRSGFCTAPFALVLYAIMFDLKEVAFCENIAAGLACRPA
jgi:hypothetical protein